MQFLTFNVSASAWKEAGGLSRPKALTAKQEKEKRVHSMNKKWRLEGVSKREGVGGGDAVL